MIEFYTDGSCIGNPGPGGFGIVGVDNGDVVFTVSSDRCSHTTNNREEMKAILFVMKKFGKENPVVYSDSSYAISCFTRYLPTWEKNGFRKSNGCTPENIDLLQEFSELKSIGLSVDLRKVPGHSGIEYNELADKLAKGE